MATVVANPTNEMQFMRDALLSIPEIEQVYVRPGRGRVDLLVVLPDANPEVQRALSRAELQIIESYPGTEFEFDAVFRCGRPLRDIATPSGTLLFTR